ncbi:MAG: hypothetical protein ACPL7K_01070 [Armatimonadota bacterium]
MRFEEEIEQCVEILTPSVDSALKSAREGKTALKMLQDGDLKGVSKRLDEVESCLSDALEGLRRFRDRWLNSGIHDYFGSDEYLEELESLLKGARVDCHRLDEAFYVYPAIVRVDRDAKTVRIDKKSYSTVRPSKLTEILQDLQNCPGRPRAKFLRSLFNVYKKLASSNLKRSERWEGKLIYLKDIYSMMSSAPDSDYSEQEFVRDLYLLDASGEPLEVSGHIATFQASSGRRNAAKTLSIITRDGQRKVYCTIRFDPVTG